MKKIILLLLFSASIATAQSKIFEEHEVENKPMFPGGWNEYIFFVEKNFKWIPKEKLPKFISVEFIVQTNGLVTDVKVLNPIGTLNENEALRVMALSPKWVPATLHGKAVPCHIKYWMAGNPYADNEDIGILTVEEAPQRVEKAKTLTDKDDNRVYNISGIEIKPRFPGDIAKLERFFNSNFQVPEEDNLKGKITTSFTIEKDGSLSDIKVMRDIGYGTGGEAIRVLRKSPKWIPGKQNGKPIRVQYTFVFALDTNDKNQPIKI
ncbi:energy transducer TonB [Flavobacterium sp. UBA4854]|uniref:energy transducer TonB n=1 Tax=Flavobacterium sp. UBA4854 TaxID=1946548 RepID=UPI00257DCEFD|nr:energy transducer TonB [Flavobacterium sp. UBA4854]